MSAHSRLGSHQCGKGACWTHLPVQDSEMHFQRMLKKNYSLTEVLRLGLNLDVIVSFCLYKIRGIIISRKFALLCSVAAAVALFKHLDGDTQIQTPKTGNGHCKFYSGCPGMKDNNKSLHFVNHV